MAGGQPGSPPPHASEASRAATRPTGTATAALSDFKIDGAALYPSAAFSILPALTTFAEHATQDQAGIRLQDNPALHNILATPSVHEIATGHLGSKPPPVRAILFDKTPATSWSLG